MSQLKDQIQALVASGRTEDALALFAKTSNEAVLLQARYANGKKQYNIGLMEFGEWSRIQNQVNYALLEMADKKSGDSIQVERNEESKMVIDGIDDFIDDDLNKKIKPKVFISYNHGDQAMAKLIFDFLTEKGCEVSIDIKKMAGGTKIDEFIIEQIKGNGFVLSVVSKNSLKSGWVGLESNLAMFSDMLEYGKFVPVMIDKALFDDDFFFEVADSVDVKLNKAKEGIKKAQERNLDSLPFETEKRRLQKLRDNLGELFNHFRTVLTIDLSDDSKFEEGMDKVVETIFGSSN